MVYLLYKIRKKTESLQKKKSIMIIIVIIIISITKIFIMRMKYKSKQKEVTKKMSANRNFKLIKLALTKVVM